MFVINGTGDDDNGRGDDDNGSGDDDNGAGNDDGDEYNSSAVVKMLKRCVRFRGFKLLALGKLCQQIIIIPLIPSHALYLKISSKSQHHLYLMRTFIITSLSLSLLKTSSAGGVFVGGGIGNVGKVD